MTFPTLEFEAELLSNYPAVIAMDEVGRGSLAGPVAVGAFVLTRENLPHVPAGLQDSKLISEAKRPEVAQRVHAWGSSAVAFVSPQEIDQSGIISCLRKAGQSCLDQLGISQAIILLDGNQNWLEQTGVLTKTKADRDCAAVSAASIVAKVTRDALMLELDPQYPQYGFASNKGYSSPSHIQALRTYGPSDIHRKTWLSKILAEELF